jgi:hypothetical protein
MVPLRARGLDCGFLVRLALRFLGLARLLAAAAVALVLTGDDGVDPRANDPDRRGHDIDHRPDAAAKDEQQRHDPCANHTVKLSPQPH